METGTRFDWRWIAGRVRQRWRCVVALSLAFKVLNLIVLAPLAATVLRFGLAQWGRASVGNFELIAFFLSPIGLTAALTVGAILLATLWLELSGLIRLLADDRLHWWEAFRSSTRIFPRLAKLGLAQVALQFALAAPFLLAIALVYQQFWSGRDLNGLIILRPPEFWRGAGIAALLAAGFAVLSFRMLLRQLLAPPATAFEPARGVRATLKTSAERSEGRLIRSALAIAGWAGFQLAFSAAAITIVHFVLAAVLNRGGPSVTAAVLTAGSVFAVQSIAAAGVSIVANVTFAAVVLRLYQEAAPGVRIAMAASDADSAGTLSYGRMAAGLLVMGAILAVAASLQAVDGIRLGDRLEITAHRAGATHAPENTVAALTRAIQDGADWAEIDVQLTSDKAIVVMHDIDLARVGGGSRRVDSATLAEIQSLDVGAPFRPEFAGERIPTFEEMLVAAGDGIRLNVELKPHSREDAPDLTRRVIAEIQRLDMADRCRVCSQSYESLQLARRIEPQIPIGFIVATSVGDPVRLNVDFLMLKSDRITRRLVDRAHARGIAVHAWTVNDPAQVGPLLDAGTDNLITDDPAAIRSRWLEIQSLSTPERLLLRAAHAIAR
ncbi:MAG: glycerophosphoryl diester phosphodiesterase membrane domain-containing protein [Planctomyces sp.]|nr:glycerophosphoryl diester phosphodiesterase membrane domain-containing protein [Planctomyces sp.]